MPFPAACAAAELTPAAVKITVRVCASRESGDCY